MRKALYASLLTGLFLLLLSALVVTPQEAAQPRELPVGPARLQAVLMPMPAHEAEAGQTRTFDWRAAFGVLCVFLPAALPRLLRRDSNGRVLCALRYENSVYQVFRPEVAGG